MLNHFILLQKGYYCMLFYFVLYFLMQLTYQHFIEVILTIATDIAIIATKVMQNIQQLLIMISKLHKTEECDAKLIFSNALMMKCYKLCYEYIVRI